MDTLTYSQPSENLPDGAHSNSSKHYCISISDLGTRMEKIHRQTLSKVFLKEDTVKVG